MKRKLFTFLKIFVPIIFGILVIWYFYYNISDTHRHKIITYIQQAPYGWVALSLILAVLSHLSRAYRWKYLLDPLGYRPRLINSFIAVMAGYFANLGVPRSGEFLRASILASNEQIPFEKSFGTIVTERVVDFLMLFILISIALAFQSEAILGFLNEKGINYTRLFVLAGLGILGLFIFIRFIKSSSSGWALKVKNFITGLWQGITSILHMRNKGAFVLHTVIIWTLYLLMFWVITFTVPGGTTLGFDAILTAFIAGSFAMSATNGGIGVFPLAVGKTLALYGISEASGDAFGWIMWISQTLLVIILGGLALLLIPFFNKKR